MKSEGISNFNLFKDPNKDCLCSFKCGTCDLLGDHVKTRYEIVCILADNDRSIFSSFGKEFIKRFVVKRSL